MLDEVLEKLAPMLPHARHLQLHGLGEPLMSPVFWHLLETLPRSPAQFVEVNTNGLLLTERNIARILRSPLRRINISLDAATAETYRKIRGASLARVVDNIAALLARRADLGVAEPAVTINMTLMRENIGELRSFIRLAAALRVDSVDAWHLVQGTISGNDPEWRVEHQGWAFSYRDQHLSADPAKANRAVRSALDLAASLGVSFEERPELWLSE